MYRHILLAVALQQWDECSPHAVAAREAAVALTYGFGAQLSVLSVYDYDDDQPDVLSLPLEGVSRDRDTQMQRVDAQMEAKMKTFLAGVPIHDPRSRRCSRWGIRARSSSPLPRRSGSISWSLAPTASAAFSMSSWAGRRPRSADTPLVPS